MALLAVVLVVASLRLAREIFIPLALAILFSFLLSPLVTRLRLWHVPKAPAVLIVVLFAFAVVGVITALMVFQMVDLAGKLPGYQQNIHRKVDALTPRDGGVVGYAGRFIEQLRKGIGAPAPAPSQPGVTSSGTNLKPTPVEVHVSQFSPMQLLRSVIGSVAGGLITALVVIVFVIFILLQRDDLRDRVIRLAGTGKLNVTTQLLDEAGRRLSRYLLVQLIVNVGYGIPISLGLFFIGVPNPFLWGLLAALLRYVPYAGTWIAAAMPFALAMAVDPGWTKPLLVAGLWLVVELTVANFIEPWVYGATGGITPLAVLFAAVFWAWVWGPVGLLLSTPLTVCLVTMGRYIPSFEFLSVMLGDEPPLSPSDRLYQRLLAQNQAAAAELTDEFLQKASLEELYDTVILPALVRAEEERSRGMLDQRRYRFVLQASRLLVEESAEYVRERRAKAGDEKHPADEIPPIPTPLPGSAVVCIPVRGKADAVAAVMLVQCLDLKGLPGRIASTDALDREKAELDKQSDHEVFCVSALPPAALEDVPPACERVQTGFPHAQVLVGVWYAGEKINELAQRLDTLPRENFVSTLRQAVERILHLASVHQEDAEQQSQALPQKRF